jgi:hypothetical protein
MNAFEREDKLKKWIMTLFWRWSRRCGSHSSRSLASSAGVDVLSRSADSSPCAGPLGYRIHVEAALTAHFGVLFANTPRGQSG